MYIPYLIIPSVDYNLWLKRLNTELNEKKFDESPQG